MRLWDKELKSIEKPIIEEYLSKHNNNVYKTANDLGINRETLYSKINRYEIVIGDLRYKKGEVIDCNHVFRSLVNPLIKEMIERYYMKNKKNQAKTAKELGISAVTLRNKMIYLGIDFVSKKRGWRYE